MHYQMKVMLFDGSKQKKKKKRKRVGVEASILEETEMKGHIKS